METFKLNIFKKENPSKIIDFYPLNLVDSNWILQLLGEKLEKKINLISTSKFFNDLDQNLKTKYTNYEEINKLVLKDLFKELNISDSTICFVIWNLNSNTDLFEVKELVDKWEYIWYDASDEAIVLFMPSIEKVLLITEHGYIKINNPCTD